jgi:hypothetical protein
VNILSTKASDSNNIKSAVKKIRREEKEALFKAEYNARQAIRQATETREREITAAKEAEIRTLREMQQQFDDTLKNMREANRNKLKEINDALHEKATEARNLEKRTIREAYDEESVKISSSDQKSVHRIKYETLRKIQQARYDTEKTIDEALFEEKHARRKVLDMAYLDIEKEEESQSRIRIRTVTNARNTRIKAINDVESNYRKIVLETRKNYHADIASIKKQSLHDIDRLKKGLPSGEDSDNQLAPVEEQLSADIPIPVIEITAPEDFCKAEAITKEEETVLTPVEDITVEKIAKEQVLTEETQVMEEAVKNTVDDANVESYDDAIKEDSNVQITETIATEEQVVYNPVAVINNAIKPSEISEQPEPEHLIVQEEMSVIIEGSEQVDAIAQPVEDEQQTAMEPVETTELVEEAQITAIESAEATEPDETPETLIKEEETQSLVELAHEVRDEVMTYKETSLKAEDVSGVLADDKPKPVTLPDEEITAAPEAKKPAESEELFNGIVRIAVKSPVESNRIKLLGEELNKIDRVRMLFIGGEVNKDTVIHVKLDEEMPLIDILKGLPDVADVSVTNKNIQLTLKTDK